MNWPAVNPGEFRDQIVIQAQTTGTDSFGQPLDDWMTVVSCYGKIELISADIKSSLREKFQANQFTAEAINLITIPWVSNAILPGMRAVNGSREFVIQGVNDKGGLRVVINLIALELGA